MAAGTSQLPALLEVVAAGETVPNAAKEMLAFLGEHVTQLDERIAELERRMKQQHKANPVGQLLAEVPGIGPIGALSLALTIDLGRFTSGRHFAAWLGLTPKERSTGGRQRLGGISRAGNERLRRLLVLGATAVIRLRQAGEQDRLGLAAGLAGAQAAQAIALAIRLRSSDRRSRSRGGGSGQQDGPHRVGVAGQGSGGKAAGTLASGGHDGDRGSVSG